MRLSIPGFDGLYFDTDAESPAISLAFTAAGRRAPKPQGYAIQILPHLWSFEVDLREVPTDHPVQYLHPEGAQSLGRISGDRTIRQAGNELESVLQFVWAVNRTVETASNRLVGREPTIDGVSIEITEGQIEVDGEQLDTDEFDIDTEGGSAAGVRSVTEIDVEDGSGEAGPADTDTDPTTDIESDDSSEAGIGGDDTGATDGDTVDDESAPGDDTTDESNSTDNL